MKRGPLIGAAALALACVRAPVAPEVAAKRLFDPVPAAQVAAVKNPHSGAPGGTPLCQRCHVETGPLVAEESALCRQCHRFGHGNHPVDVVQKTPAESLPLGPGGKLACHTCHEPHDIARRGGLRKPFNDLCKSCHRGH
jgi:predicted CXXCH cytochrome family protein